ncbi:MAG: 4-(cytidine 5'-diphospho)-2-C-methyl-D-erythritol kinase [Desulfitobacteriia bacterium]|jgi:4-diphosphocytidyl-2-C-methyl-D-erythritol kinase
MKETSLELQAPAKINLALAIKAPRADGYHDLETIFQTISLADRVRVTLSPKRGICCSCGHLSGEQNLAYQAARLFREHYQNTRRAASLPGIEIEIAKHIPLEAGLAGGSSDAAAVLWALNFLCANPFTEQELLLLAQRCGSDTAFCLRGGTQWGEGKGTELAELPPAPEMDIVIAKPSAGISTAKAYRLFAEIGSYSSLDRELWVKILQSQDREKVGQQLFNSLEIAAFRLLPEIRLIKELLLKEGCLGALMSGSGSAVFGIVRDKRQGERVREVLAESGFHNTWLVKTVKHRGLY